MTTMHASPLRGLLGSPLFRRRAVANLFARLPLTMNLLLLLLAAAFVPAAIAPDLLLLAMALFALGVPA